MADCRFDNGTPGVRSSASARPSVGIVVPTVGRPELPRLLASLVRCSAGDLPPVLVVDDRRRPDGPLFGADQAGGPASAAAGVKVLRSGGRGPAAARNAGWRALRTDWVAFLDDDVEVEDGWIADLHTDLLACGPLVGASQGRVSVPRPPGRSPTDWERNVIGLESARWATADMAYRRRALEEVGGLDERFPRAYREDADLGLRVTAAGWVITTGGRTVRHPVRPAGRWISIKAQAGNRDDVLMRALHGRDWRRRSAAGPTRTGRHLAATAALAAGVASAGGRRPLAAGLSATLWAALTTEFASARIGPGPRDRREVTTMLLTSAAIPPVAVWHLARGLCGLPSLLRSGRPGMPRLVEPAVSHPGPAARLRFGSVPRELPAASAWQARAVLFDRDGTLIADRSYLRDPDGVAPLPGARRAVEQLRRAGVAVGVVTNQSGVARGLITEEEMRAVNQRVDEVFGGFDTWSVCTHRPEDGCGCRKPAAGLVLQAAAAVGVAPSECAVIGDIAADARAAAAAGARSVLVPTRRTRAEEIRAAIQVAPDILTAVDLVLAGRC